MLRATAARTMRYPVPCEYLRISRSKILTLTSNDTKARLRHDSWPARRSSLRLKKSDDKGCHQAAQSHEKPALIEE
jgi:hypothetical protein